jgi:hypothetical protein
VTAAAVVVATEFEDAVLIPITSVLISWVAAYWFQDSGHVGVKSHPNCRNNKVAQKM